MRFKSFISAVFFLFFACSGFAAHAQTFPDKPVRLIVPFPPGGGADTLARILAKNVEKQWKQPVVVEYKPGAGGVLGTDIVARAPADGYTLGLVVTSHVINPSMRKLPYDTLRDFSGVTMFGISHVGIFATPSLPVSTIRELVAYAKANPGKLSYATPGVATSMHMGGELLKSIADIDMVHVPYKGGAQALVDVMSGTVPLLINSHFISMSHLKEGKIKAIALTSPKRALGAPEIPLVAETFPGFNVLSVYGFVVPSATPRAIVHKLNGDILAVLQMPEVRAELDKLGVEPAGNSPEDFDQYIRAEIPKWEAVIRKAGITPE